MYKHHICEWNTHFTTQKRKLKYLLQMHELCTLEFSSLRYLLISSPLSSVCSNVTFSMRPGVTYYLTFCKCSLLPNSPAHFYSTFSFPTAFNIFKETVSLTNLLCLRLHANLFSFRSAKSFSVKVLQGGSLCFLFVFLYCDVTQKIFAEIMTFTFSFFSQARDHYHRQAYIHCPG